MTDVHIKLAHGSMEVGLNPENRNAGGSNDQQKEGKKAGPKIQEPQIIAFHKSAAGFQSLTGCIERIIQKYIAGQSVGQG